MYLVRNLFIYNLILAFSNITIIFPLLISYHNTDTLTFFLILFTGIASFTSHLCDRRFGLPGAFPYVTSTKTFETLNRIDIIMAKSLALSFVIKYYSIYGISAYGIIDNIYAIICMSMAFLFDIFARVNFMYFKKEYEISDNINNINVRCVIMGVLGHSLWHIYIYIAMYIFLINYYINYMV